MNALQNPCLVLNANWSPINIFSVENAIKKVWNEGAKCLDTTTYIAMNWDEWAKLKPEGELFVQGVRQKYRVPEIVVLTKFDKLPTSLVTFSRCNIFKRDKFHCQFCNEKLDRKHSTIDHVIPKAQGGTSTWNNCVLACKKCNADKADRTPEQAGMKLLSTPRRPVWQPLYSRHSGRIASWEKFVK